MEKLFKILAIVASVGTSILASAGNLPSPTGKTSGQIINNTGKEILLSPKSYFPRNFNQFFTPVQGGSSGTFSATRSPNQGNSLLDNLDFETATLVYSSADGSVCCEYKLNYYVYDHNRDRHGYIEVDKSYERNPYNPTCPLETKTSCEVVKMDGVQYNSHSQYNLIISSQP